MLAGVIESTGMTTQARSSYLPSEVLWGHRFEPLVSFKKDTGEYEVDYSLFNNTYEVDTPLCSAKALDDLKSAQQQQRQKNNEYQQRLGNSPPHVLSHLLFSWLKRFIFSFLEHYVFFLYSPRVLVTVIMRAAAMTPLPTSSKNVLFPYSRSSNLKMEVVYSSETLITMCQSIHCHVTVILQSIPVWFSEKHLFLESETRSST
jgi:hypothetical protein